MWYNIFGDRTTGGPSLPDQNHILPFGEELNPRVPVDVEGNVVSDGIFIPPEVF